MNRRDFELIAKTIRNLPLAPERIAVIADRFETSIAAEYPSFNREKFLKACGCSVSNDVSTDGNDERTTP